MKRSCGSCRFYQEARLAGSGWCHHPQRRTSSHALIMVRKGELACRNGWAHDLWTPKATHDADAAAGQPPQAPAGPVKPANPEDIAAIIKASTPIEDDVSPPDARTPTSFEDVVVGQTSVMPETQSESDDRATVLAQNTRAAILRARDRHRAKQANRSRPMERAASDALVPPSHDLDDNGTTDEPRPVEPPEPSGVRHLDRFSPMAPRDRELSKPTELGPPSGPPPDARRLSRLSRADDPYDSVPQLRPDFELPRAKPTPRQPLISSVDSATPTAKSDQDGANSDDHVSRESAPEAESGVAAMPAAGNEDWPEPATNETSIETTETELAWTPGLSAYDHVLDRARKIREAARRDIEAAATIEARAESPADTVKHENADYSPAEMADRVLELDSASEHGQGVALRLNQELRQDLGAAPYLDDFDDQDLIRDVVGFAELDDDIDMTVQIAPEVPRMCRTCRDFRPADSGERGWCTNNWAFTHRRMVDADELPCETSVGCWWLPHDDVWLSTADILAHGQPTPLLNSWLAQREAATIAEHGLDRKRKRS